MDTWGEYADKFPNYSLLEGVDTSGINIL